MRVEYVTELTLKPACITPFVRRTLGLAGELSGVSKYLNGISLLLIGVDTVGAANRDSICKIIINRHLKANTSMV